MRFRAFPERVGARILSLQRVDNFGISEHSSGRRKKRRILIKSRKKSKIKRSKLKNPFSLELVEFGIV